MVVHVGRQGPHHRDRPGRPQLRRRRRDRRPVVLSRWAFRIRSRGWDRTVANSCWPSPTAGFPRTRRSPSPTCSPTCRRRCWRRISASAPGRSTRFPAGEKFIFQAALPPPLKDDTIEGPAGRVSPDMKFRITQMAPKQSPGGTVRIVELEELPGVDRASPRRWSRYSPGICARCTGTRTPTSGSTTSKGRRA